MTSLSTTANTLWRAVRRRQLQCVLERRLSRRNEAHHRMTVAREHYDFEAYGEAFARWERENAKFARTMERLRKLSE